METSKLPRANEGELRAAGVQSLANRPNELGQYGVGGLSAKQLKEHFDKAVLYLAKKYNELLNLFGSTDFLKEVRWSNDYEEGWSANAMSVADLKERMLNGAFVEYIKMQDGSTVRSLGSVIRSLRTSISSFKLSEADKREIVRMVIAEIGNPGGDTGGDTGGDDVSYTLTLSEDGVATCSPAPNKADYELYVIYDGRWEEAEPVDYQAARGGRCDFSRAMKESGVGEYYAYCYVKGVDGNGETITVKTIRSGKITITRDDWEALPEVPEPEGVEYNLTLSEDGVATLSPAAEAEKTFLLCRYAKNDDDAMVAMFVGAQSTADFSGDLANAGDGTYFAMCILHDDNNRVFSNSITVGVGTNWLFEFALLTTTGYRIDLPAPAEGVSYTAFVNGIEVATATCDSNTHWTFFTLEDPFCSYTLEWVENYGWSFSPEVDHYETSEFVSIRINESGGVPDEPDEPDEPDGGDGTWTLTDVVEEGFVHIENGYLYADADPMYVECGADKHYFDPSTDPLALSELDTGKTYEVWTDVGGYRVATLVYGNGGESGGSADGNWLFKNEYISGSHDGLPYLVDSVSYTCFVNGKEIATVLMGDSTEVQFTNGDVILQYNVYDPGTEDEFVMWSFGGESTVQSGTVSIRINKTYLFEDMDMPSYDNCGIEYEPAPAVGVIYHASVNGVEIGSGLCYTEDDGRTFLIIGSSDAALVMFNDDDGWCFESSSSVQSGAVSVWHNSDQRYAITFPTRLMPSYIEDYGDAAGGNAVLRVELAEGVSVDDDIVNATLYLDGSNVGTKELTVTTGSSVEFDFEGFAGEYIAASGYNAYVDVTFSINGEQIAVKTHSVDFP